MTANRPRPIVRVGDDGTARRYPSIAAAARDLRESGAASHAAPQPLAHAAGNGAYSYGYRWRWDDGGDKAGSEARNPVRRGQRRHGTPYPANRAYPLWAIWSHYVACCEDPHAQRYGAYGGRGIRLDPGIRSYGDFAAWAARVGYEPGMVLVRDDQDGDFSPQNCHWERPSHGRSHYEQPAWRSVEQLADGKVVARHRSVTDAAVALIDRGEGSPSGLKATRVNLSHALKGQSATAYGYQWRYTDGGTPAMRRKAGSPRRQVESVDRQGKTVRYPNSHAAAKALRDSGEAPTAHDSSILIACKDQTRTAYGYHWRYAGKN